MSEIQIEIKNLPQIKKAFLQAPQEMTKQLNVAIKKTVFYIRGESVKEAPVRTSFLRGSAYTSFGNLKGETGFKAKYASFVHDGTSPYTIRAKSKPALYWEGAAHPVKSVKHPGIRANPYLKRAVYKSTVAINRFFYEAVNDALEKIAKDTQ